MGNINSTNNKNDLNKPSNISQIIDFIASEYIFSSDFKSLKNLHTKEYCDKLIILTSNIISNNFSNLQIKYLAQRIKNGIYIDEQIEDKFLIFDKNKLNKLDIENNIEKKRICNSISKFYIKIAHIFSAILMTINPIYSYKDENNNIIQVSLKNKGTIPENVIVSIMKLNICSERINSLNFNNILENYEKKEDVSINPQICSLNNNLYGNNKSLIDEPGMIELEHLYYDDDFDYITGNFNSMSEKSKKDYDEDVLIFYNIFSNSNENKLPENIKKFSDIKLRDYINNPNCNGTNPLYKTLIQGNYKNNLIAQYAENLKHMIMITNKNQEALLEILSEIFVYYNDEHNNKKIRVNPLLNEDKLQKIVIRTRALIIKLYLTCEIEYNKGLKIYEALIEQKILNTSQQQIKNLENQKLNLLSSELKEENIIPSEIKTLMKEEEEDIKEEKDNLQKNEINIKQKEEELKQTIEELKPNISNLNNIIIEKNIQQNINQIEEEQAKEEQAKEEEQVEEKKQKENE